MSNLKRTISEERRILNAKALQEMLMDIKQKFIQEDRKEEFHIYCDNIVLQHQNVFDPSVIEIEITNAKRKKEEDKIVKYDEVFKHKKQEIEIYLKNNIVKRQSVMNDLKLYESIPINHEDIISNLKTALDLQDILSNNHISNKIYIGRLLMKIKYSFEDINVLLAHLSLQNIHISKSDYHFSINLFNLAEKYHKMSLLSIPLRYFKSNFKMINNIFEENKEFWLEIE